MTHNLEPYKQLWTRLRSRHDSEHIQSILRILAGIACLLYVTVINAYGGPVGALSRPIQLAIGFGIMFGGIISLAHIICFPGVNPLRRWLGIIHDMSGTGLTIFALGDSGIAAFGMYIWIVIGNGFRFGLPYLYGSAALALISFYAVAYFSAYYQSNYGLLTLGTFLLAVVIPIYLGTLLKELKRNLEAAREADRLKTRFLANVSHDLRTPLHVILANCEVLQRDHITDGRSLRPLLDMREAATTLQGLVTDLLDVAKLQAGRIQLEPAPFNLLELLGRVMRINQVAAKQHGTRIHLTIEPGTTTVALGDRLKLEQILNNVVSNAVKYTEHGYVHIQAMSRGARDSAGPDVIVISVRDTGIGMDEEALQRIFTRFEQADESYGHSRSGAGLGLSIAKELVTLMGGMIDVESSKGNGSCFTITLPMPAAKPPVYNPNVVPTSIIVVCALGAKTYWQHLFQENRLRCHVQITTDPTALRLALDRLGDSDTACVLLDASSVESTPGTLAGLMRSPTESGEITWLLANASGATADIARHPEWRSYCDDASFSDVQRMLAIAYWTNRQPPKAETVNIYTGTLKGRRILVADDNELNRRVIANLLGRLSATVVEAGNGHEALAALADYRIDVALLDVQMPGLTGIDVIRLHNADPQAATPLIALTADTTDECRASCLEAGATSILYKPVSAQLLYKELYRAVCGAAAGAENPECIGAPAADCKRRLDYALLTELASSAQQEGYMNKLVACFKSDGRQLLGDLEKAIHSSDIPQTRALLHRLKGMSSSIGAVAVAWLCQQTLTRTDAQLEWSGHALMKRLLKLHQDAADALESFLAGDMMVNH